MHRVVKSILVPYSPVEIFDLVNAVELYPQFMPWCGGAAVSKRGEHALCATIIIDFYGLKQSFSTRNSNTPPSRIDVNLVEGPFKHLQGHWQFIALGHGACKVVFELEYAFKSSAIELVIGPVFNMIANTFIDAFAKRAEAVYGARL